VVYGGVSVRFLEMVQVNNQEFTAESPAAQDVSKFKVSIVISS